MSNPVVVQKAPFAAEVEEGKKYWWCSCGLSSNQPFCDGRHKEEGKFSPTLYEADASKTVFFCGCKKTGSSPMCDGSHNKL